MSDNNNYLPISVDPKTITVKDKPKCTHSNISTTSEHINHELVIWFQCKECNEKLTHEEVLKLLDIE